MATESLIRIMDTSGKWASHKEATAFGASSASMAIEEMGLLLKGQKFRGSGRDKVPDRSESAPPSMEGSFATIEKLLSQQNFTSNASLATGNNSVESCDPEEQYRADPAYLTYYCSNVNLNPRLPPPLISWENRRWVRHIGSIGGDWRLTSFDDCGNGSLRLPHGKLPSHKEESEDDRSPQPAPNDWASRSSGFWSGPPEAAASGQPKSMVDFMKVDFGHAPPFGKNESSHSLVEEAVTDEDDCSSSHDHSITSSANASALSADDLGKSSFSGSPTAPVSRSSSVDDARSTHSKPPLYRRRSNVIDVHLEHDVLTSAVTDFDVTRIESGMNSINIRSIPNSEDHKHQKDHHQSHQTDMTQQSNNFQVQGAQSQTISQGVSYAYIRANEVHHVPSNSSTAEAQPVLQSSGFTPSLYATTAAYMTSPNPYYPNLQPSGYFPPQYSLGGYTFSPTAFSPYIAGHLPRSAVPVAFDATAGPSFNSQASGVTVGGHGVDLQQLNRFYGQLGFPLQPPFSDPLHMQYFQQPFGDPYSVPAQYDHLTPRYGATGSLNTSVDTREGAGLAAHSADQKLHQGSSSRNYKNPRGGDVTSPFYGNPNMGILQLPRSAVSSPVLPGSPVSGTNFPAAGTEVRFSPGFGRIAGAYTGWQRQRGTESFTDAKPYSLLDELKSCSGRRFELSDTAGHIVELRQVLLSLSYLSLINKCHVIVVYFNYSADQHGSRFIQQKLEKCSAEEKASVFNEVLPHASELMTGVFGNYVIQKFFEYGSPEQRKDLAIRLEGQILPLSLQMYGCRVIQKALEVIEVEQKIKLVHELDGHVMRCVRDQNGNHVIQKCIESIPTEKIKFIISSFRGQVASLSTHPYGCRVIQRVLEHCKDELQSQFIVDEILESVCALAQDQYGNYVIQDLSTIIPSYQLEFWAAEMDYGNISFRFNFGPFWIDDSGEHCYGHILERGKPHERSQLIKKLSGRIVHLSQHKFASNVIEKCLEYGDSATREILIGEIVGHGDGSDNLLEEKVVHFTKRDFWVKDLEDQVTELQDELASCRRELTRVMRQRNIGMQPKRKKVYLESVEDLVMINLRMLLKQKGKHPRVMMKDQYANYVVQRILQTSIGDQREELLSRIRIHLNSLKKYTYGKHIVARFEQLYGEGAYSKMFAFFCV
ncbi:hypothetical protein RJ639_034186 [Escallonia herrerae]|uniref:PUM-HD domain-containing protein n=1 Tax=Escallonia herrerae TaxID=1293975 RepID=A0AA88WUF7_9ASTE|nr:hypothetical protein RJ639_034186 [Escallonia herrerae]